MDCDNCGRQMPNPHKIYKGNKYCSTCYARVFKKRICPQCGNYARLPINDDSAICTRCFNNKPCIRCGRRDRVIGKITIYGPVCNSCSVYFRPLRACSLCGKKTLNLHKIEREQAVEWLCQQCDKENYGVCFLCHRHRKLTISDENGKRVCNKCKDHRTTSCIRCGHVIPLGRGSLCEKCTWLKTFEKRKAINLAAFKKNTFSEYYSQFCDWILNNLGSNISAIKINKHLNFFLQLEAAFDDLPTADQLINEFSVDFLRRSQQPMKWLKLTFSLDIDVKTKHTHSEKHQIETIIKKSGTNKNNTLILEKYIDTLQCKLANGKTTLRSIRLALRPAVSLLLQCQKNEHLMPTQDDLNKYLRIKQGQKAALTGFINFINKNNQLDLDIKNISIPKKQTRKTKLEKELLQLTRQKIKDESFLKEWLAISLQYFHNMPLSIAKRLSDLPVNITHDNMIEVKIPNKKILYIPHWSKK